MKRRKCRKNEKIGLTIEGRSGIVCKLLRKAQRERKTPTAGAEKTVKKVLDKGLEMW